MVGFGVTMSLIQSGRAVAGLIFLIGALLSFIFFGIRWFEGNVAGVPGSNGAWPPVINTCPDYLVETTRTLGSGTSAKTIRACIDTVGISRGGAMTKWSEGATGEAYFFDLENADGPIPKSTLCTNAITKGLSWEGVTDGQICFATGVAGAAGGASGTVVCGTPA